MNQKLLVVVVASALLIVGSAVTGYALGRSMAPTAAEWREERLASQASARKEAAAKAFAAAKPSGHHAGFEAGKARGARLGRERGAQTGDEAAQAEVAAIEEEELAELEYDPQLPNGDPGYILPEEDRSVACIGISSVTGECVGD